MASSLFASESLTVVGTLAAVCGTYLAYRTYRRQAALHKVIAEVNAYAESDASASLLIVLRNTGDEAVRVSRLQLVGPPGASFDKARKDGYRPEFLALDAPLAPKSGDATANLYQKAVTVNVTLPARRGPAGQAISLRVRCEFASSVDKSGWVRAKAILMPSSGK